MRECTSTGTRREFVRGAAATVAVAAGTTATTSTFAAPFSEVGRFSPVYDWPCVAIQWEWLGGAPPPDRAPLARPAFTARTAA